MTRLTNKLEAGFTAALWIAATILLPMAALTPVDGGRAEARTMIASAAPCMGSLASALRACPIKAL